jgi:putative flippase GtrA
MSYLKELVRRYSFFLRYAVTGLTGGALQTFLLYVWVSLLGLKDYYLWGLVVGFCITLVVTFNLQKYWTFGGRPQQHRTHRQLMMYALVALGNLGLNTVLLYWSKQLLDSLGFNFFHLWYLAAQVAIVFVVALASFAVNYSVTFKAKQI